MNNKKKQPLNIFFLFFILVAFYLIVSIPFKVMEIIPGFTDIRPVSMLLPVYGIFFGTPGCLAFAVGNLITDILSNSLKWSSIAGFAANFLGPFCFYVYWCRLSRRPFDLKGIKNILIHIAVTAAVAVILAGIITPAVALAYSDVDLLLLFMTIMLNSTAFPILIGIPLIIVMQEELGFKVKPFGKKAPMAQSPG